MPVARSHHTATVVGGKIYVVGGVQVDPDEEGERAAAGRVDAYDPAADSWQQVAPMPTARSSHAAAVVDGNIYVMGGCLPGSELFSDALEAYDPVADTWTTLASLSPSRAYHAAAVVDGKLCVFGGYTTETIKTSNCFSNLVEVYSPASNSWARAADLPSAGGDIVAVAL